MRLLRLVIAITLLSAGIGFNQEPIAAQETTATSSLSGLEIDIGSSGRGSFVNTSPEPYDDWGYVQEDFLIQLEQGEVHVSFVQGEVTTESWFTESHDVLAQSFDTYAVLGEDVSPENGWALTRETYWLQYDLVTYFEFYFHDVNDVSLGISVHTTEPNIIEYIEWTQDNILVGGDPVAMLTEIDHLKALAGGTAGVEPRVVPGFSSTVADWEESGLISETEWISPTYQTPIEWDASLWQVPFYKSNAVVADDSMVEDVITLVTPDSRGMAYVYAMENPPGYAPSDWESWWQTSEFLTGLSDQNNSVVNLVGHTTTDTNAGAVIHTVDRFGNPFITIVDTYVDDSGDAVAIYLMATPDDIASVYGDYWDGVKAYGDYYPLAWTPEEIESFEFD